MLRNPGESFVIPRMQCLAFNNTSNFSSEFAFSWGSIFSPWVQASPLFECVDPLDEQTLSTLESLDDIFEFDDEEVVSSSQLLERPSTLPDLESIDAAFEINIPVVVPSSTFSLSGLIDIALSALDKDSVVDVEVLAYGYSNKVYSLTFSDGTQVVVRLPHVDGEDKGKEWLGQILECEVATMKYAKEYLPPEFSDLIPDIYAWDADPDNPVGRQYIMMEKMEGVRFTDAWDGATTDGKLYVAEQFAEFTYALHSIGNEFTEFGSIYFDSQNDNYYIGPYIDRDWELLEDDPAIDSGPWTNPSQCFVEHLKSRLLYHVRRLERYGDDGRLGLKVKHLEKLSLFIPYFASVVDQPTTVHHSVFHTDLHAKNFLVDPTTMRLTGILDWEGMGIFPDWISLSIPSFLETEKLDVIWNTMNPEDTKKMVDEIESLRERYMLERSRLQPGYSDQAAEYRKFYKLFNVIFASTRRLKNNSTLQWIDEELSHIPDLD